MKAESLRKALGLGSIVLGILWCGVFITAGLVTILPTADEILEILISILFLVLLAWPGLLMIFKGYRLLECLNVASLKYIVGFPSTIIFFVILCFFAWKTFLLEDPDGFYFSVLTPLFWLLAFVFAKALYAISISRILRFFGQKQDSPRDHIGRESIDFVILLLFLFSLNSYLHHYRNTLIEGNITAGGFLLPPVLLFAVLLLIRKLLLHYFLNPQNRTVSGETVSDDS